MSAREAKNPAMKRFSSIDDLANIETKDASNVAVNNDIDVEVKKEFNSDVKGEVKKEFDNDVEGEVDKLSALKAKMKAGKKKQSNKQVTIYLTPENFKRFNALKEKGQKSDLINQLLDLYFEEE